MKIEQIELLKIALSLTSPSVSDRTGETLRTYDKLYNHINSDILEEQSSETGGTITLRGRNKKAP